MIVQIDNDAETKIARLIQERSLPAEVDLFANAQQSRWRALFCGARIAPIREQEGIPRNFTKIRFLFASMAGRKKLLQALEERFVSFLQNYYPEWLQQRDVSPFKYWFYDKEKKMPIALPIPFPNALEMMQASTESPLLLFLYQELIRAGILDASKPLDEKIFYCVGFVPSQEIEAEMLKRQLFLDSGPIGILHHGKFSHLLQLVLLALACEMKILKLDIPISEIVPYLLQPTTLRNRQANGWTYCLDSHHPRSLVGPFSLNILMLSLIGKNHCPLFHRAWVVAYLKHFREEAQYSLQIEEKIKHILNSVPIVVGSSRHDEYRNKFIQQHQAVKLGTNMYRKGQRSARFKNVERNIIEVYQYQNLQPRRTRLFDCWGRNGATGERARLLPE